MKPEDVVEKVLREFANAQENRSTFADHWEQVADYVMPTYRNTFYPPNYNTPGEKKTELQIDSTAMLALSRFAAIMDSMLTPRNSVWHTLEASDPMLNKSRAVKLWFEDTARRLFRLRYAPTANFSSQNQAVWQSLGAFGNGPMFVDSYIGIDGSRGLRYKALPLGEIYLFENHQGQVDAFLRCFRLSALNAKRMWLDTLPKQIAEAVDKTPHKEFMFLHCVKPRDAIDYDPGRLDARGKRWVSYYICTDTKSLMSEGGYNTFPLPTARDEQAPGEFYGRGPVMRVLPAIKTLNAQKRIVLKQGHRTVDPVLFTHDDGILNVSMKPGAINAGGVNRDGRLLVQPLPIGNVMVGKDLMDDERMVINDALLVNLFQVLLNDPKVMTATQIIEMANQKGILLAPTVGRHQSGYLGPLIDRELDIASDLGLLLPMPPELVEAQGDYQVVYTSPMSRVARMEENSGFLRSVETALNIANTTGDQSVMDIFDLDTAIPEMADNNGSPERWMSSPQQIAEKRAAREAQMQQQAEIAAAPGAAAMMKARALASQGKQK
jgi:hypothetical protein